MRKQVIGNPTCAAQEFVAIVLMVSFLMPQHAAKVSGRQFLEVFAGRARTSRLASWCGYTTSAVDLCYSRVFDVLKPAGFMLLSLSINTIYIYIYLVYIYIVYIYI